MNGLLTFAKKIYDDHPDIVKKLGLLDLGALPFYRSFYMKQIEKKMEGFLNGACTVEFEITNACNADCLMCPNTVMNRAKSFMDTELFKQIADALAASRMPFIRFVFAGLGEPTLDPQLVDKIRYLKEKMPSVPVQLTTNASRLTEQRSKELLDAGLDQVIISFNGTSKESYKAVMRQLDFDKTLQNVLTFLSLCKNGKPHVTISCVRLDVNAADFARFEDFWKEKGVQVSGYKTPIPLNRGGNKLNYSSKWALPKPTAPRHFLPCRMMGENILIQASGKVALCCMDYEGSHIMGQFGKNTLQEVLQTKREWFNRHKRGDFSHTGLCMNCTSMREQVLAWWKEAYF